MINKGIIFVAVLFMMAPTVSTAQTTNEGEYRAYLLALIELLQQQVELLQQDNKKSAVGKIVLPVQDVKGFESFLIEDVDDVVAEYEITDADQASAIDNDTHKAYFNRFFELVPDEYDDYFISLLVFAEGENDFDGFVETVSPYKSDTWRFGVSETMFEFNPNSSVIEELFVHEFGHIISYEGIVGRSESRNIRCHEFFSNFGCPPENSYIIDFVDEFWTEDELDELVDEGYIEDLFSASELRKEFVSEYATTNPAEDFAETFTYFVLEDEVDNDSVAAEKVNYFYQFNKLIMLREEILQNL